MHAVKDQTPPDRELRQMKADKLAHAIARAIKDDQQLILAYALGRLDEKIGEDRYKSIYELEKALRDMIATVLDIWPDPFPEPPNLEVVPADALEESS
jgi:hypothetical protein